MESKKQIQKERQYYIDWLRILLILSVFIFHVGMVFNNWPWHVKNDVTAEYKSTLWYLMVFLGKWRMPLLVLISGAGTYFALGKRTSGQYIKERFKRLFIPLLVGIFTLVPIQVYIEKSSEFSSLLNFYPHMFDGVYPTGNFSWHHLWFIAYLFLISLIFAPFIRYFRSEKFDMLKTKLSNIVAIPLGANVFLILILISELILRQYFPENTHDLVHDWAAISFYLLFFLFGFVILSNNKMVESIKNQRRLFLTEGIISTIMLFTLPYIPESDKISITLWQILSSFVAWSWAMIALGYGKGYLNKDGKLRKIANEAIYPFYLLHQPVIVVVANYIVKWDITIFFKVLFIALISFVLTILIYWAIVYPFNFMRVIFGMKPVKKDVLIENRSRKKLPVLVARYSLMILTLLSIVFISINM